MTEENLIDFDGENKSEGIDTNLQETFPDASNLFQEAEDSTIDSNNEQELWDLSLDSQEEKAENNIDFQGDLNDDKIVEENDENMEDNIEWWEKSEDFDVEKSKEGEVYDSGDESVETNQNEIAKG